MSSSQSPSPPSNSVLQDILSGIFSDNSQTQQQYLSIVGLLYQAGITFAAGAGAFVLFTVLRPKNARVYARRYKALAKDERRPPKIGKGLFSWIPIVWRINEQNMLDTVDIDSVYFLRFIKLNMWLFGIYSILGMCLIVPLNYVNGNNDNVTGNLNKFALLWITLYHITTLKVFWLHLSCAYVMTAIFFFFVWREYKRFITIRQNNFASSSYLRKLQSRTLMLTRVPADLQSDAALHSFVSSRCPDYSPSRVSIARKIGELQDLIDQHEKAVRKLEKVLCKYLAGDHTTKARPQMKVNGAMVDSIEHYTQEIESLEAAINKTRHESETFTPTSVAFLSYSAPHIAHNVKRSMKNIAPALALFAPHPKDIIWSNAQMPKSKRITRLWLARLISIAFCFVAFWPVAGLTFIADAANIQVLWKNTTEFFMRHNTLTTIWQSTFSPLILALYYIAIPHVFRAISRYQGIATHTGVERSVLKKMYVFYFLSNIGVFTLVGVTVRTIFKRRSDVVTVSSFAHDFVQSLNLKAQFWTSYVSLRSMNATLELAQLISLVLIFFKRYTRNLTPRELRDLTRPPEFDYSPVYSLYLWVFTISMFYSTYSPIVLPFAFIAFVLAYWVYKYALIYVYQTKHDTAGEMWRCAINRMIVSMCIYQVYLIVCLRARMSEFTDRPAEVHSSLPIVYTLIPLPVITAAIGIFMHIRLGPKVDYMQHSVEVESFALQKRISDNENAEEETLGDRFLHPIYSQPLTTPMVDKRVRHLLPKVYRGRASLLGPSKTIRKTNNTYDTDGGFTESKLAASIANASTVYGSDTLELESAMDERDRRDFDGTETPGPFTKHHPGGLSRSYSVDSNGSGDYDSMEMRNIGHQYSKGTSSSRANLLSHAQISSPTDASEISDSEPEDMMMMVSLSNSSINRQIKGSNNDMYGRPDDNHPGRMAMLTQQPPPSQFSNNRAPAPPGGSISFADNHSYDLDDIIGNNESSSSSARYMDSSAPRYNRTPEPRPVPRSGLGSGPYQPRPAGPSLPIGSPRTANMSGSAPAWPNAGLPGQIQYYQQRPQPQSVQQQQPYGNTRSQQMDQLDMQSTRYGARPPARPYGRPPPSSGEGQPLPRNVPRWD